MPDAPSLSKQLEQTADEIARHVRDTLAAIPAAEPTDPWPSFLEALREMTQPSSQAEILQALIRVAREHSDRVALFVVRRGRALGWAASGFRGESVEQDIREVQVELDGETVFREVMASRRSLAEDEPRAAGLSFLRLGETEPREAVYVPMATPERVVGILYADVVDEDRPLGRTALEVLTLVATMALERFLLRERSSRAAAGAPAGPPSEPAGPQEAPSPAEGEGAPAPPPLPEAQAEASPGPLPLPDNTVLGGVAGDEEDAGQFARLLVTEIQLYHDHEVVQGRVERDLYRRLREPIERSRRMYEERVASRDLSRDYFEEQIVELLAGGDPEALGPRDED